MNYDPDDNEDGDLLDSWAYDDADKSCCAVTMRTGDKMVMDVYDYP